MLQGEGGTEGYKKQGRMRVQQGGIQKFFQGGGGINRGYGKKRGVGGGGEGGDGPHLLSCGQM